MPLVSVDITPAGTATSADPVPPSDGVAGYRWIHWDLDDPALPGFCAAHLPAMASAGLLAPETRPRSTALEGGLLLTLRGVNLNEGSQAEDMVSLRLWARPGLIVSTRRRRVFAVEALRAEIEDGQAPRDIGEFLFRLAQGLTLRIETVSLALEDTVDDLEESFFDQARSSDASVLSPLLAKALKLRRHVGPQRDALRTLSDIDTPLLSASHRTRLREVLNRATRTVEELDSIRDRLASLGDHLDREHDSRLADNSYRLSVLAAIVLPLSLLTGLFGINLGGMPGGNHPWGFTIFVLASAGIGGLVWWVLKRNNWL